MTTTQSMTGCNSMADAVSKAVELSLKYEQSFLCENIRHTCDRYIVFTHKPFLHNGEELLAEYRNGEMIKS